MKAEPQRYWLYLHNITHNFKLPLTVLTQTYNLRVRFLSLILLCHWKDVMCFHRDAKV